MIWRRDKSSPSGRICSTEGRPIQERRRILIAQPKEVAMRWSSFQKNLIVHFAVTQTPHFA